MSEKRVWIELDKFAAACFDQNTIQELENALTELRVDRDLALLEDV